jgi:hypothetical protein
MRTKRQHDTELGNGTNPRRAGSERKTKVTRSGERDQIHNHCGHYHRGDLRIRATKAEFEWRVV